MSVYKAVSNYFVEVLDFLQTKVKRHENLKSYFGNLGPDGQKELIVKLSDTLLRINMLFTARTKYWEGRKKEQKAVFSIFITIATLIGVILYLILLMRIKKEYNFRKKDGSINFVRVLKSFITYSSVYMVILTVFVLMIINSKKLQQMFDQESKKARREGEMYIKYMFDSSITNIESSLFQLAVVSRGKLFGSDMIDGEDLMSPGKCGQTQGSQSGKASKANVGAYYNCQTGQVNYQGFYNAFKNDLQKSLTAFYNEGKGYDKVREIYVLSGPIPILKETRRILDSYYFLTMKEKHGKEDKPNTDAQNKEVLKENLILPLYDSLFPQKKVHDPDAFNKSMANVQFASQYKNMKLLFMYTAVYSFQVYSQRKETNLNFLPALKPYLPSTSSDDKIKDFFKNHSNRILNNYMNIKVTDVPKMNEGMSNLMSTYTSLFLGYYSNLASLSVSDEFLYSREFVMNDLMNEINTVAALDDTYKMSVKEFMYNDIVVPIKAQLDTDVSKLNSATEKIATDLSMYNITLAKYSDFIMSDLLKELPAEEAKMKGAIVSDVLSQLTKSIAMKKQLKGEEDPTAKRFLETSDFEEVFGDLRYNQIKQMLETNHLSYIVDAFYKKISDSVSRKDKTTDNIYFITDKNHELYKVGMIMVIITIVLVWFNFFLSNALLGKYLYVDLTAKIQEKVIIIETLRAAVNEGDSEGKLQQKLKAQQYELELLYREKRNRFMNWLIRLLIPLFVVVFVISLLIAMHKKMKSKHEFNVDLIENNTSTLKNACVELKDRIDALDLIVSPAEGFKKVKELPKISAEQKQEIFKNIKLIIERYEKCNFILEAQKSQLPFPYSDLAINGFMIFVTILCIFYVYTQFKPMQRLKQIKELNKMKEEALIADKQNIKLLKKDLEYMLACHEDDIDAVIFTLKVVFFIFIITFLVFYSTKVISQSNEYMNGLYNSVYFENNSCVE